MIEMITLEELQAMMPRKKKKNITQTLVDMINAIEDKTGFEGEFTKKVVGYSNVLESGRYKLTDYVNAVEFVTYYLNGDGQAEAYMKTFPEKVKKRLMEGKSAYATGAPAMYYSGQLVQSLMAQAQLGVRVRHYDKIDRMVETLFGLAISPDSTDRIKMESADKLLNHLKEPEESKVEIEIGIKKDQSGEALEAKMLEVAMMQKEAFEKGIDLVTLQKININEEEEVIDAEVE